MKSMGNQEIIPSKTADTFSSSTAEIGGFDDLLEDATYELISLAEPEEGLIHAVFKVNDYYFTDRIDRYLLFDRNKSGLFIDLGHPKLTGTQHLQAMLDRAGISWADTDAALTHFHVDHVGGLGYFCQHGGRAIYHGPSRPITDELCSDFACAVGLPELWNSQPEAIRRTLEYANEIPAEGAGKAKVLVDGDRLDCGKWHLQVLETPGHSLEHICLADVDRKILFAGDHVIDAAPAIMQFNRNDHSLKLFFDSFERLKKLGFETVYMSHHEPLRGTESICAFYDYQLAKFKKPLEKRLQIVESLGSATVAEITAGAQRSHGSFASLDFGMRIRRYAMSLSLLEYLADTRKLKREQDSEGVLRYSLI